MVTLPVGVIALLVACGFVWTNEEIYMIGLCPFLEKPIINATQPSDQAKRFNKMLEQCSFLEKTSNDLKIFQEIKSRSPQILRFGHRGRKLVDKISLNMVKTKDVLVVMEVGVWLGHSLSRWLGVSPKVRVIGVDNFKQPNATHYKIDKYLPQDIRNRFGNPRFNRALIEYIVDKNDPEGRAFCMHPSGLRS
jgi:hypothetical protein